MTKRSLNAKSLADVLNVAERHISRYMIVLFLLLLAAVYGFLLFRVDTLSGAQPSGDQISAQVKAAAAPHVDPATIKQMQALQDNSVSVHALFDQARSNPFQE